MPVWERKWKMNLATQGLAKGEFRLEKHMADGLVYYTMSELKCDKLTEQAWGDCRLVRRGRYLQAWSAAPLDPFKATNSAKYTTEINKWLDTVTSATLRLEGDLEVVISPKLSGLEPPDVDVSIQEVTMLMAGDAVKLPNGKLRDLMILRIRSKFGVAVVGGPDGTGTGDPT
jgi:hypothetical protein